MKKSIGERLISGLTSALIAISYIVPTGSLFSSFADYASDGVEIVTDDDAKVELLVGNNSDIAGATVSETIENAQATYLLGIASQFGVFLEGNFSDNGADVESRLAVGGGANLSTSLGYDFEIGNGDYITKTSLEALLGSSGFAHAIIQGGPVQKIATTSWEYYELADGNWAKLDKTFVIGSSVDLSNTSTNYTNSYTQFDTSYFRKTDEALIDFVSEFAYLRSISEKLSTQQQTDGTEVVFSTIKTADYDTYSSSIVEASALSGTGNVAHLNYSGSDSATVVKFNLTAEEWEAIEDHCNVVSFEGIPENANIIINVPGTIISFSSIKDRYTFVNGRQITPGDVSGMTGTTNSNVQNNDEQCEHILYNFYEATSVALNNNFSGNVFAPNADVTGENNGHLSGALIAKSFSGSFEFGYRPYQGLKDLLEVDTDYTISVKKTDSSGNAIEGAVIGLYTVDTSSGEETLVETVKSAVDDDSTTEDESVVTFNIEPEDGTTYYVVREVSAPEGYEITDDAYYFSLTLSDTKTQSVTYNEYSVDVDYNEYIIMTVYDNETYSSVVTTFTYYPHAIEYNSYVVDDDVYTFTVDNDVVKAYLNGTELSTLPDEMQLVVMEEVTDSSISHYLVIWDG